MKEQSSEGKCLWCNQKIKDRLEHLHKGRCKEAYYDSAERALKKARLEEYPEMNVIERSHRKKINICRLCKFPITEKGIEKVKAEIEQRKLQNMNGLCESCIKIEDGRGERPLRRTPDDKN